MYMQYACAKPLVRFTGDSPNFFTSQVAAGGTHSVVLTREGHVWTWGQPWPPGDMYVWFTEVCDKYIIFFLIFSYLLLAFIGLSSLVSCLHLFNVNQSTESKFRPQFECKVLIVLG